VRWGELPRLGAGPSPVQSTSLVTSLLPRRIIRDVRSYIAVKTAQYKGPELPIRSHPWTTAVDDDTSRYYDFKASPWLIRTAIEDLLPWQNYAATESMFSLIEWLNAAGGALESNDFQFSGPLPADARDDIVFESDRAMMSQGRVMILYRQLALNTHESTELLHQRLHEILNEHDRAFQLGLVATAVTPVRFIDCQPAVTGAQVMISFWAWGATERATMRNIQRVMRNLHYALRRIVAV
jgi:hypothetical protein